MKNRKKIWTIATVVLLAAGLTAGLVLAQEDDEATDAVESTGIIETNETTAERTTLMERVSAILGIEESVLEDAFAEAQLQGIDEAVATGDLTEEQAEAMKAQIEARGAMQDVLDEAIASGALTEEQLELLKGRMGGRRSQMIGRMQGMRNRLQSVREEFESGSELQSGRGAFFLRTQRGAVGGTFRCGP